MARPRVNGNPRKAASHVRVSHAKGPGEDDDDDDERQEAGLGDDTPAGPQPVDALSEMMAGLQGASTSRITVYRIVKNQPPAYVFETDPTGFSLDDLRDKYNGGEFRLYVMKDGRLWKNMRVVVEPKQIIHGQDPQAPSVTPMTEMLAVMRDGFAAQAAAMRESIGARSSGTPFSMEHLPAIITAAAAAITALRPPTPPAASSDSPSKYIDMFMQGLQFAREAREDSSPGDNSIGGMLRDVLKSPILASAVQQTMAQQQRPAAPALPNPTPQVSHAKPDDQPAASKQDENQMLKFYLNFLVDKAKSGADASLYAELVLDNVSDAQLTPMLARGDALIDDLIAVHAPVGEHREWFVALLAEVHKMLESEEPEQNQTGAINATDATAPVVPGNAA